MSTFDYKSYHVTIEQDVAKFFPGADALRGIYSIWQSAEGNPGRQIYRGHTHRTFKCSETADMIAASAEAARAWIDSNEGKPWA